MKAKLLTLLLALIVPIVAISAPRVEASASGCTLAPGAAFAQNCITVVGEGQAVVNAESIYNAGAAFWSNVCNIEARFKYKPVGVPFYLYQIKTTSKCGISRGYVSWWLPGKMANGSSFCATQRNSVISSFANYACVGISA